MRGGVERTDPKGSGFQWILLTNAECPPDIRACKLVKRYCQNEILLTYIIYIQQYEISQCLHPYAILIHPVIRG